MNTEEAVVWLQNWYANQCNGLWEQSKRIQISTIDNPGWSISINLKDTYLEGKTLDTKKQENSDTDWFYYWIKDNKFEAAGGSRNLLDMIKIFRRWIENGII